MKMYLRTYSVHVLIDLLQNLLTWVTHFFCNALYLHARIKKPKNSCLWGKKLKCRKTDIIGHVPIFTRLQKVKYIIQNPTTGDHRGHAIKNSSCQKKLLKQNNCSDFTGKVADLVFLLIKETRVLFSQTKKTIIYS